jgi:hypothetical protein
MDVLVLGPYLLLKSENQTQSVGRRPLAASTIGG